MLHNVFLSNIPLDPKCCVLSILEEVESCAFIREAISRASFQSQKFILQHLKSADLPYQMDQKFDTLRFELYIYQQRGCPGKYEKLWANWLNTPGLRALELAMARIHQCPTGQYGGRQCLAIYESKIF